MVFFLSFREVCLAWLSFYFVYGNRLGKAVLMKLPQHFGMRMIYCSLVEAEVRVYLNLRRMYVRTLDSSTQARRLGYSAVYYVVELCSVFS